MTCACSSGSHNYCAANWETEYSDERVCLCLCVCLSVRNIFGSTRPIFTIFCARYLWPWVGPRRRNYTLCTSGLIDDVIFAHKPRLLDVAARLKRSTYAALGLAIIIAQQYQLQANGRTGLLFERLK